MIRLLKDADALSESFNLQVDENEELVYSYADIVDAIHIVQTEMGITGTTAKEASSTIAGSTAAMKASWSNLLTGLANENADMDKLIDEFVDSVGVAADNILPRFEIALDGTIQLVEKLLPMALEKIPEIIVKYVPKLVSAGVSAIMALVKGIKDNAKELVGAANEVVFTLIDGIADLIPEVIDAAAELLSGTVEAIPDVSKKITKEMPRIIKAIVEGLAKGVANVSKAVVELFVPIGNGAQAALDSLNAHLDSLQSFNDLVAEFSQNHVDLSDALSENGKTISQLEDEIESAEGAITTILSNALAERRELRADEIADIEEYNNEIRRLEEEKLGIYRDQQLAELRKIQLGIAEYDVEQVAEAAGKAEAALRDSNDVIESIYAARLIQIENYHKANGTIGSEAYQKDLEDAKKYRDEAVAVNESYYNDVLKLSSERLAEIAGGVAGHFEQVGEIADGLKQVEDAAVNAIPGLEGLASWGLELANDMDLTARGTEAYIEVLEDLDTTAVNAFLNMEAASVNAGNAVDSSTSEIVTKVLGSFETLIGPAGEAGKSVILELIAGLEKEIPELKNASDMSAAEIIDTIKKHFSIEDAEAIGSGYANALGDGFVSSLKSISGNISGVINDVFGSSNLPNQKPTKPSQNGNSVMGSHASGLSYVPFDGYIAELHKGERVLTAEESKMGTGSSVNISVNVSGAEYPNMNKLANVIAEKIERSVRRKSAAYV